MQKARWILRNNWSRGLWETQYVKTGQVFTNHTWLYIKIYCWAFRASVYMTLQSPDPFTLKTFLSHINISWSLSVIRLWSRSSSWIPFFLVERISSHSGCLSYRKLWEDQGIIWICQNVKEHFTFCFPETIKKTDSIKTFYF